MGTNCPPYPENAQNSSLRPCSRIIRFNPTHIDDLHGRLISVDAPSCIDVSLASTAEHCAAQPWLEIAVRRRRPTRAVAGPQMPHLILPLMRPRGLFDFVKYRPDSQSQESYSEHLHSHSPSFIRFSRKYGSNHQQGSDLVYRSHGRDRSWEE